MSELVSEGEREKKICTHSARKCRKEKLRE
jgi:hypothetical protein